MLIETEAGSGSENDGQDGDVGSAGVTGDDYINDELEADAEYGSTYTTEEQVTGNDYMDDGTGDEPCPMLSKCWWEKKGVAYDDVVKTKK